MGDIIHTLPAAAALRRSFPQAHLTWLIEPRWRPLLDGSGVVDEIAEFDRTGGVAGMWRSAHRLRGFEFDLGIDFQGLIKSAVAMRVAGPLKRWGRREAREGAAKLFYTDIAETPANVHIVEQHLDLVRAAGAGELEVAFPLPAGKPEGNLPGGRFVLASPLAGWTSKQWPIKSYAELASLLDHELGVPLVLNVPPGVPVAGAAHVSGIAGLIDATRRAAAVVGVDSGPLHLAAALAKPGVAIFGPTDPERNGPYGGSLVTVRAPGAKTSYRRESTQSASMRAISPAEVFRLLRTQLAAVND